MVTCEDEENIQRDAFLAWVYLQKLWRWLPVLQGSQQSLGGYTAIDALSWEPDEEQSVCLA